jgi:trans-aconitate methyltransferase
MTDYEKKKENIYWNDYYNSKTKRHPNSEFSEFVLGKIEEQSSLIDIGCGDGRDTHFLVKIKSFQRGLISARKQ